MKFQIVSLGFTLVTMALVEITPDGRSTPRGCHVRRVHRVGPARAIYAVRIARIYNVNESALFVCFYILGFDLYH